MASTRFIVFLGLVLSASGAFAEGAPSVAPAKSVPAAVVNKIAPLTPEQLKQPAFAIAASREMSGGAAWDRYGGVVISGVVKVGNSAYQFSNVVDLRTGYYRTNILLPAGRGAVEYGMDAQGGWNAQAGIVKDLHHPADAIRTVTYVQRYGFYRLTEKVAYTEGGVDPNLGDKIIVKPAGGTPFLLVIKPSTRLVGAIQYEGGQVNVFSDYRRTQGVFYPYVSMQGMNVNNLNVFQAQQVQLTQAEPSLAAITRPVSDATPPAGAASPRPTAKPVASTKPAE